MHPQTLLAAITVLAMGVVPSLALPEPEAIPELLVNRARCVGGHHLVGSGCPPGQKTKTSCSADDRAVIVCKGNGPTWQILNRCQRGSCNDNCVCT